MSNTSGISKESTTLAGDRLPLGTRLGYGAGDLYGGGAMFIVSTLYLIFLTDIVGIRPALAGAVVFVARAWDAISDPLMGMISDRTRTRWGRRRPYFLFGIPLIVLSYVLLWYPAALEAQWARFAYALLSYLFFSTVITMVMTPYNALASELTLDYDERSRLTSFRIAFSEISTIVSALVPLAIIEMAPNPRIGYPLMGAVFGLFFALPFLATFLTTWERPGFSRRSTPPELKVFLEPFRIRTFRSFIAIFLFAFVAIDVLLTIIVYWVRYYLEVPGLTNYLLGTLLIVQLIFLPGYYRLSRALSKRAALIIGACVWVVAMLAGLFIRPGMPAAVYFIFAGVTGAGTGGVIVMAYSIYPDVPDVDELVTGRRREGIYAGSLTLLRKLTSAFAIFLIGQAIDIAGYIPPTQAAEQAGEVASHPEQTAAFLLILRVIFAGLPLVFIGIAIVLAARFPLSPGVHARLKAYLARRREAAGLDSDVARDDLGGNPDEVEELPVVDEAEERSLRRLLVGGR